MSSSFSAGLRPVARLVLSFALLGSVACEDSTEPTVADRIVEEPAYSAAAPTGVTEVAMGADAVMLWPFTGTDVAGTRSDPINLLFPGHDVRDVRTALLALNGDRSAFGMPPVAPFNCVWSDAIGANQTTFTEEAGWQGSAIQLECGNYAPMRFHVRLFDAGDAGTVGNAHFEVIIPGTNQHEVLSWELAEALISVDMIRSGRLIAPPGASAMINPAPTFKTINPLIYNGLPVALRSIIGGPLTNQAAPVPIPSNGRASVFVLGSVPAPTAMDVTENTVLNFGQVIPKPFCAAPGEYVYVSGPIDFSQHIVVTAEGEYTSTFAAQGILQVTPINPLTGQPLGAPYRAQVKANYLNVAGDGGTRAVNFDRQVLRREGLPDQRLVSHLQAGLGSDFANVSITCN